MLYWYSFAPHLTDLEPQVPETPSPLPAILMIVIAVTGFAATMGLIIKMVHTKRSTKVRLVCWIIAAVAFFGAFFCAYSVFTDMLVDATRDHHVDTWTLDRPVQLVAYWAFVAGTVFFALGALARYRRTRQETREDATLEAFRIMTGLYAH